MSFFYAQCYYLDKKKKKQGFLDKQNKIIVILLNMLALSTCGIMSLLMTHLGFARDWPTHLSLKVSSSLDSARVAGENIFILWIEDYYSFRAI